MDDNITQRSGNGSPQKRLIFKGLSKEQIEKIKAAPSVKALFALGAISFLGYGSLAAIQRFRSEDGHSSDESLEEGNVNFDSNLIFSDKVNDSMSFEEAFRAARTEIGAGGFFNWHGQSYSTFLKEEWEAMTAEEKDNFLDHIESNSHYTDEDSAHHQNIVENDEEKLKDEEPPEKDNEQAKEEEQPDNDQVKNDDETANDEDFPENDDEQAEDDERPDNDHVDEIEEIEDVDIDEIDEIEEIPENEAREALEEAGIASEAAEEITAGDEVQNISKEMDDFIHSDEFMEDVNNENEIQEQISNYEEGDVDDIEPDNEAMIISDEDEVEHISPDDEEANEVVYEDEPEEIVIDDECLNADDLTFDDDKDEEDDHHINEQDENN